MMICFSCTAETKDELDRLVATGSYRDYGEAIAASIRNQLIIEQEVTSNGPIVINGPPSRPQDFLVEPLSDQLKPGKPNVAATASSKSLTPSTQKLIARKSRNNISNPSENNASRWEPAGVPAIFGRDGFPTKPPRGLAELPSDMWVPGQPIPLDRWILGQQNRLLPAKVNCRALIRLFADSSAGLPIGPTAERLAGEAALLGDFLAALDKARKTPRDDALSTAFPTSADDADKARTRYANQFVVYQNGRGELSGLMVDLKLINVVTQRKERLIVPTHLAWEFACLPNPVLDAPANGVNEKFSPEEQSLLLRHIGLSVPVESFAYRATLKAIQEGNNTPEKIDAVLKAYVAEDRVKTLSQSFLASQRSGAVSRMSDLGLVERQRDGIRVSYAATQQGKNFLHQDSAAQPR